MSDFLMNMTRYSKNSCAQVCVVIATSCLIVIAAAGLSFLLFWEMMP